MVVKVVDASAIAAFLFGEPEGVAVLERIDGHTLIAPTLFGFELANVCVVKCRRNPDMRDLIVANFARRNELGIEEHAIDYDGVVATAAETGLSGYDASYLWLARLRGVELITLDRKLARIAAEDQT